MSDDNPPTEATGDDLAYVIYTSGSTGVPKGAMISNRNLASAFSAYENAYALRDLRCHLQLASFSFDVFTGDVIRALLVGAKLVLCPLDVVVDPPRLYELMVREGVDAVELVPATATLLFDYAEREGKAFDFMRLVAIGGEAWRNEKYTFFKRLCGPHTRLINSYGLTEATMDSTWFEPPADAELQPGRFVPIGRPFANTRIYVLDANLEPAPIGIPGELCIGGVAVGQGYLNRPELTAERFLPDPFSDEPEARLYRTGDLARRRADGTIEFVGRADRQLKIRGFRVEPGEIEAVLERHPAVQAAAVTARDDNAGDTRLVAYVTPADPMSPPVAGELYDFATEHVPGYMVPAAWMVVEAPPLTPNGKIDVDALPAPEWERSATDRYRGGARGNLERGAVGRGRRRHRQLLRPRGSLAASRARVRADRAAPW
jgi:amino acid adenylation domain-containing protein